MTDGFHLYSFLLPVGEAEAFLKNVSWDYRDDDLLPHVDYVVTRECWALNSQALWGSAHETDYKAR